MRLLKFSLLLVCLAVSSIAADRPVLSESLKASLATNSEAPLKLWLFFDSTQTADRPIVLSERALKRRAKVDPVNFLISETDYPLRPELIDSIRQSGIEIKYVSRWFKGIAVELPREKLSTIIVLPGLQKLDIAHTLIGFREPDETAQSLQKTTLFDSAFYGVSYTQNRLARTVKLHNAGYTGRGVLIAMFDSGFDPAHQAFDSTSLLATWDFINDREDVSGPGCPGDYPRHQDRHGTATWSVAGAYTPDTVIGAAYRADYALAKTEITCGGVEIKTEEFNWIAAAEWADSLGADIITASLGYFIFTDSGSYTQDQLDGNTALITIAADLAASKNILMVNSAGNERNNNWGTILFPADGDSVLAVGAIKPDSSLTSYTSPGPSADGRVKPDVVTMGEPLAVAYSQGGWTWMGGTSFSGPLLAASAALIMESGPTLTAEEVRLMIIQSASRYDNPDSDYGYGIFDATKAANIIAWSTIEPILLEIGSQVTVDLALSGRLTEGATMRGLELPDGITLTDMTDGIGQLYIDETALVPPRLMIELVAAASLFEDTTSIEIITYDGRMARATIGPNPFADSVRIFINHSLAVLASQITITVFNLNGEKIREIIYNSTGSADTIVWDGRNSAGHRTAPGMYIILVQADATTQQFKVLKTE